jgi:hypothetical protein
MTLVKKAEIDTQLQKKKIFEVVKWGYLKQMKVLKMEEMTQNVKNSRRTHTWIKMAEVLAVLSKIFFIFDE